MSNTSPAAEEDDGEKISAFLEQLKEISMSSIHFHMENFETSNEPYWDRRLKYHLMDRDKYYKWFQKMTELSKESQNLMPQGIDLRDIKHYRYDELSKFTNDLDKQFVFGTRMCGRFLKGKIHQESGQKDVVIKTWDVHYTFSRREFWLPRRLHNEIMVLTSKHKDHTNLPKLIGYSMDKKLVVIYDTDSIDSIFTVLEAHLKDNFDCKRIIKVASQVACLIQYFHNHDLTIGSIDSTNILLEKEDVIKLCEFGFTISNTKLPSKIDIMGKDAFCSTQRSLNIGRDLRKLLDAEKKGLESDIFAFGHILWELITITGSKPNSDPDAINMWICWKSGVSISDENIEGKLTNLALNCLNSDPSKRPKATEVVNRLDGMATLMKEEPANKKQKI